MNRCGLLLGTILSTVSIAEPPLAAPSGEDGILAAAPPEATLGIAWSGGGRSAGEHRRFLALDAWTEIVFATLDRTMVPVSSSWSSASRITDQLVPDRGLRMHACDDEGRRWIQLVHWSDPVAIERGLQRLGTRAMGRGRFRLPVAGIEVAVRENWLVLGPLGSPWIESTLARLASGPETDSELVPRGRGDESSSIRLLLRHDAPVSGVTRWCLVPESIDEASIELDGIFEVSPLPIRPASAMASRALETLEERFALVVQESGVGLLDPRLVEIAAEHPEVVPPSALRRVFASNRLVVLDGESIDVSGVGFLEVPTIAIAVPLRSVVDGQENAIDLEQLQQSIDEWLRQGVVAIRDDLALEDRDSKVEDPASPNGISITRKGGIRHLSLGPDFLKAMGGHPMATIGELAWTLRGEESPARGWLVVGSSIGLVRRVADRLEAASLPEGEGDPASRVRSMHAVVSPKRLAGQVEDLARLRSAGEDEDAAGDATILDTLSELLSGFHRIEWVSSLQEEKRIRARVGIRRVVETADGASLPLENDLATNPAEAP